MCFGSPSYSSRAVVLQEIVCIMPRERNSGSFDAAFCATGAPTRFLQPSSPGNASRISKPSAPRTYVSRRCKVRINVRSALAPPPETGDAVPGVVDVPEAPAWRKPAVGAAWLGFATFLFFLGPGSMDSETFRLIFQGRFEEVNNLFFAIFLAVGAMGFVYAGLLVPGASKQEKFDPLYFGIAGTVIGFVGLGPYLSLRNYAPYVTKGEFATKSGVHRYVGGRIFGVSVFIYALYTYYIGLALGSPFELLDVIFYSCWQDTGRLMATDRGVAGTVVDMILLSTCMWGPLTEDMRRRGWVFDSENAGSYVNALCILAAPLLGPSLYLAIRPDLPEGSSVQDNSVGR